MEILKKTNWAIVEELSKKDQTPTELAKKLNMSVANADHYLSILGKNSIVKKISRIKTNKKGRPFNLYSLDKGFIYIVEVIPKESKQIFLEAAEDVKLQLRIWQLPHKEIHYHIAKFWWQIQDQIEKIQAIAIFGSAVKEDFLKSSDIDILVISPDKKMQLSTVITKPDDKSRMLNVQIFTEEEFRDLFVKGSKFANETIKTMHLIYDPKNFLWSLKNEYK